MPKAHVTASVYGETLATTPVGDDGSFRMRVDTTGVFELQFTGAHHQNQTATTYVDDDTLTADVRLATYPYSDDFSDLKLMGTFNDFSFDSGTIPMTKQDDGTYTATVPAPGDSVGYQLLNAHDGGRSINGTQSDRFVYDGGGDYRSFVAAPGDSAQITFDPEQRVMGDAEANVDLQSTDPFAERYTQFAGALDRRQGAFVEAMRSAEAPDRQTVVDTFDWSPNHERLEKTLGEDLSDTQRHVVLATYLEKTIQPDSAYAQQAMTDIPASSPVWAMASGSVLRRAYRSTGKPDAYQDVIYDILRTNPVEDLKPRIIVGLLQQAQDDGDEEMQKLLYTWLVTEYPDSRERKIADVRYAPGRRIQVGRTVPSFEVSALQADRTFTPENFDGQYVLLDFWATWCAPCVAELPTLRKAHERYGGENFSILSISLDGEASTVRTFLDDHDMPWKHAFGEQEFDSEIAKQFDVMGIPKPVLIGPDGTITATESKLRGETLLETLEKEVGTTGE